MAQITAEMVKQLREQTGAGMMDCKAALAESGGDFNKAIENLRKNGLKDLAKKAGKVAAEGTIGTYIHNGERVVALVELNCQTDFVGKNDEFKGLAKELALHVAAMKPMYVAVEDIPEAVLAKEKEIITAQLTPQEQAKADKIIPGKMEKFYQENVLLKQIFVKDEAGKKTVGQHVEEYAIKSGEKIVVRRMIRFEVGEGIEKVQADFAAEVAEMTGRAA